jgi:hypothetical protein
VDSSEKQPTLAPSADAPTRSITEAEQSVAARVLISACALAVCGAFYWASTQGAFRFTGAYGRTWLAGAVLALIALMGGALPWLHPKQGPKLILAGSLLVGALCLRWLLAIPLLFAWLTVWVSRRPWRTWQKLVLLLGTWTALAVLKWTLPTLSNWRFSALSMYWACLPPAIICLVVERGRGWLEGGQAWEEWAYLLSPPRFFLPFLQPIGARRFIQSRQATLTPRLALSALGLALYGVLVKLVGNHLDYTVRSPSQDLLRLDHVPRLVENGLLIYAVNAGQIFCAVALFRLLGYGLGSGFRYPLLSSSFSDLFRRWNYYFYEYVSSIFYLPLVSRFQRWMPLWLAYILAGYPSILLGVWVLDNVTFQLAIGKNATPVANELMAWPQLAAYAGIWSLIIFPQVIFARARRFRKRWWYRAGAHALTLAAGVAILIAVYSLGVAIY